MPLLRLSEVVPLLTSPCCFAGLDGLKCPSCGLEFAEIEHWPVLIDFASSVLDKNTLVRAHGASNIDRERGRISIVAKRIFGAPNPVAQRNVARMRQMLPLGARVLIIGGGNIGEGTYQLYEDANIGLVALDIYASDNVQLIADAHRLPFESSTFDAVIIQAVLEHVLAPSEVVDEIRRVLSVNGLVYAETPFLQHVHEGPWDFTRFTDSGHRWLFRAFDRVDSGPIGGPAAQLVWSLSYLFWGLFRSRNVGRIVRALSGWLRLLDRLIPRRYWIDSATGVYFLGTNSGRIMTKREIVMGYEGAQGHS